MLIERMRKRLSPLTGRASSILPPIPSRQAPVRLQLDSRDQARIRLITRGGNDWTQRYPLVAEAVNHLKVRLCLIDGEVVC
jgi:hypothetical protein